MRFLRKSFKFQFLVFQVKAIKFILISSCVYILQSQRDNNFVALHKIHSLGIYSIFVVISAIFSAPTFGSTETLLSKAESPPIRVRNQPGWIFIMQEFYFKLTVHDFYVPCSYQPLTYIVISTFRRCSTYNARLGRNIHHYCTFMN